MPEHEASNNHQSVRQVVLPSGKTIEVVYFDGGTPVITDEPQRVEDLQVCPCCSSFLVYPVDWEEAGLVHWEVTLRCPNCEHERTGFFHQELVERLDEQLDRGTETLVRDLKRLMHQNMVDEIERFEYALEGDLILPEDF